MCSGLAKGGKVGKLPPFFKSPSPSFFEAPTLYFTLLPKKIYNVQVSLV